MTRHAHPSHLPPPGRRRCAFSSLRACPPLLLSIYHKEVCLRAWHHLACYFALCALCAPPPLQDALLAMGMLPSLIPEGPETQTCTLYFCLLTHFHFFFFSSNRWAAGLKTALGMARTWRQAWKDVRTTGKEERAELVRWWAYSTERQTHWAQQPASEKTRDRLALKATRAYAAGCSYKRASSHSLPGEAAGRQEVT